MFGQSFHPNQVCKFGEFLQLCTLVVSSAYPISAAVKFKKRDIYIKNESSHKKMNDVYLSGDLNSYNKFTINFFNQ